MVKTKGKSSVSKPPDGGYGWAIVFGAALTHFFLVGSARSLGLVYEDLRVKFGGTAAQTAWVAAIFNTTRSIVAPLFSWLCKKWSCRIVTMLGGLFLCIGFIASAFASNLYLLYVTFGIAGCGGAMVFTPGYIMVGDYFEKKKGKAMALATIGSGLGSIVIAPLITLLIYYYSFHGTMIIMAAIQLHHILSGALYRPLKNHCEIIEVEISIPGDIHSNEDNQSKDRDIELTQQHQQFTAVCDGDNVCDIKEPLTECKTLLEHGNEENKEKCIVEVSVKSVPDNGFRDNMYNVKENGEKSKQLLETTDKETEQILDQDDKGSNADYGSKKCTLCKSNSLYRNVTFYIYGYLIMSMQVCIQSFLIFLPGYAKEKGVEDTGAALVLSIFGFADMGGRFIFGFLFDLKYVSTRRRDFYCLVSGLFGICAMTVTFVPNFISLCVLAGLTAIFEGATHSQRATVLSDFIPKSQMPSAVGLIIFCQGVGNIWGPPFAGFLRDISGTNAYGFIFCGSVMFSASLVFFLEKRIPKCR